MNKLNTEKRKQLKIVVVLIAIIFFVIYSAMMYLKYTGKPEVKMHSKQQQITFDQPRLQFFQFTQQLNAYPDRITIHSPYLIIVRPNELKSEIYNMDTKLKEKEVSEVLLDYYQGNADYNKQGYLTYFNKTNLKIVCDQAFIKSPTEILCITRPDQNKEDNKLISINPQTLEQKDIYASQNVLTAVYFDKSILYVSEYDFVTNRAYVTVNGKTIDASDLINVFYPMNEKFYGASYKSLRNKQTESYYEITLSETTLSAKLAGKGSITFFH